MKAGGRHFEYLLKLQKVLTLTVSWMLMWDNYR